MSDNSKITAEWCKESLTQLLYECCKENQLQPPKGRCIHLLRDEIVVKISNGDRDEQHYDYIEKDQYPKVEDLKKRDENEVSVLKQLHDLALVPKVYYYDKEKSIIIQEYIQGENLEDVWTDLSHDQKEDIKMQVAREMTKISSKNIKTLPIKLDERYDKAFEGKLFFTHGDLNPSNVIVKVERCNNEEKVISCTLKGIIDWEFAGAYNLKVMSDINEDMCERGESLGLKEWADLFDVISKELLTITISDK